MPLFAYIQAAPTWKQQVECIWNNLIQFDPEFICLRVGDWVLSLEPCSHCGFTEAWLISSVFRVSKVQETGDAICYWLDRVVTLSAPATATRFVSEPNPPQYVVTHNELLQVHSWIPAPQSFFRPLPRPVWHWLRHERGVPLPDG